MEEPKDAEEHEFGLKCPHCKKRGKLKVAWTYDKGATLRRYAFRCSACGEPVTGWLTLD